MKQIAKVSVLIILLFSAYAYSQSEQSRFANNDYIAEYKDEIESKNIRTFGQLCAFVVSDNPMLFSEYNKETGNCIMPDMVTYHEPKEKFRQLSELIDTEALEKSTGDFQAKSERLNRAYKNRFPEKNRINFAGINEDTPYLVFTDKLCELKFIEKVNKEPKSEFCNAPMNSLIETITYHDGYKDTVDLDGVPLNRIAGNKVDVNATALKIKGVEFTMEFEFEAIESLQALAGLIESGDPYDYVPEHNYAAKYRLDKVSLRPTDRDFYTNSLDDIKAYFVDKFGAENVYDTKAAYMYGDKIPGISVSERGVGYHFNSSKAHQAEKYVEVYNDSRKEQAGDLTSDF